MNWISPKMLQANPAASAHVILLEIWSFRWIRWNEVMRRGPGQCYCCPYKKGKFGHRYIQREEGGRKQFPNTTCSGTQPCWPHDLGFLASWALTIYFCSLSCPGCGTCYSSPRKLTQHLNPNFLTDKLFVLKIKVVFQIKMRLYKLFL